MNIEQRLAAITAIVNAGVDISGAARVLDMVGLPGFPREILGEMQLYSEHLPKVEELGFTSEQRYLHFLWDALDKTPMAGVVNFAIPVRRLIAKRLFKRCGKNFIAEEGVRFNFGHNIEAGDNVFFNRWVFLDSKGGIALGNSVALAEGVEIYTHSHSQSDHVKRSYGPVVIRDFACVYSRATILPGVTIGEQAIVGARSLVSKDVPPNQMVAGIPARVMRERQNEGKNREELHHIWLHRAAFQDEP